MRPIGLLARSRAPSWSRISGRPVMTLASPPAAPHHVITGPAGMEAPAQGTWTVRRYSTDTDSLDKSQVLEICAKVYDGSDYMPRMLDSYAADPHVLLLVAETLDEGGKPMLGGIIGADRRGEVAFVFGLRVREETRGQGVGKLLMSQLYLSVPSALPASPPISKIITVTVEINKPAMAIISNHMTGPLHRVDSFPGRDALEMYQNHIGWCDENTNPTTLSTMLDVVPGLREVLESDELAMSMLPKWRRATSEDDLYDVVSSIRNGHTPSDTSATSSTPMPDQLKQSDHGEGAHLSMWLPYFYEIHPVRSHWMRENLEAGNVWVLPSTTSTTSMSTYSAAMVLAYCKEGRRNTAGILVCDHGRCSSGSSSAEVHSAIMTAAREQTGFVIAFIHRVNGGELLPEAYKVAGSGLGYITYGGPVPSEENN